MRTLEPCFLAALVASLSSLATGQHCSSLGVHGSGHPGTDLTFTLTHADPNAPAFLFLSGHTGHTVLDFGALGSLTLGLAPPLVFAAMGTTDEHGAAQLVVPVPLHVPSLDFVAQGTSVVLLHHPHPALRFCPSDVAPFHVGV
jgi:hypothetical protein